MIPSSVSAKSILDLSAASCFYPPMKRFLRSVSSIHLDTSEEWIFVTGDRDRIRTYMNEFFRYPGHQKPDEYRETETDLYARELRISLVFQSDDDEEAFIRGVYWEGIRKGEVKNDSKVKDDITYLVNQKNINPKKQVE